jgi:hypothetical protein
MATNINAREKEIASACAEAIFQMNQGFFNELIYIGENVIGEQPYARAYKIVQEFSLAGYVIPTKQKD